MTDLLFLRRARALCGVSFVLWGSLFALSAVAQTRAVVAAGTADYIVAIVNQELVTNAELQARLARVRDDAARSKTPLPPNAELRRQVLDVLIDERVQVTNARETAQSARAAIYRVGDEARRGALGGAKRQFEPQR